tara:strand:- start:199 stop:504 length:306 start_codon:yes stop_codon:yes gene_type:complete
MYKKTAVMISISLSATLIFSADLSICKIEQPNSKSGMESSIQSCEAGELLLWKKLPTNFTFELIAKHCHTKKRINVTADYAYGTCTFKREVRSNSIKNKGE